MKPVFTLLFLFIASTIAACPFCKSPTATKIRASLFGPDFTFNLFVTLLPFVIFSIITLLIYKSGRKHKPTSL